jgi:hypothetical protein
MSVLKRALSVAVAGTIGVSSLAYTAPAASADVANSCRKAVPLSTNAWKQDTITSATDVDWYKFRVEKTKRVRAVLGNLPANYGIQLHSACGRVLKGSNRGATYFEEINKTLRPGTYHIRVSSGGATSPDPYAVRFQAWKLNRLSIVGKPRVQVDGSSLHTYVEVLNTTRFNLEYVKATVSYFNASNRKIATTTAYTHLDMVQPMQRQSIDVLRQKPRGFHHARVRVSGQRTTERAEWLRPTAFSIDYQQDFDRLRFRARLVNPQRQRVQFPWATVTGYDKWGNISGQENLYPGRRSVPARGAFSFADFEYTPWNGIQWYILVAQGI